MMRHFFTIVLLMVCSVVQAARMVPGETVVKQSDGTLLTVMAYGDETLNYFATADGVLLVREGTDYYVANVEADGTLTATPMLAHCREQRGVEETKLAEAQKRDLFVEMLPMRARQILQHNELQTTQQTPLREPLKENTTFFPHNGEPKALVVLVEFSDSLFRLGNAKATFDKCLNAEELFDSSIDTDMYKNYGSVKRYFKDVSHGAFAPQFDVYGPVNVGRPLAYYGKGASSAEKTTDLLIDACMALDEEVDFGNYDANGDGYIDVVYVVYAGYSSAYGGNSSDCLHPKSGTVTATTSFDGKKIRRYGISNELHSTPSWQAAQEDYRITGIGVFCHEFSHCLGLPDLYPTPGTTPSTTIDHGLDYWSLMDAGEYTYNGYRPTEYTAWERECMGWTVIDTLKSGADITLETLARGGKAYRIMNDAAEAENEYYIVENIQNEGWNKYVLGHGMTVMHVDYKEEQFTVGGCKVNSTMGHPRMTLIAADGMMVPSTLIGETITATNRYIQGNSANQALLDRYDGQTITSAIYKAEQAGDAFPGTASVEELTDSSTPTAWVYEGDGMGKPITDIAEDEVAKTVTFKFMGGTGSTAIDNLTTNSNSRTTTTIYSLDGKNMGNKAENLKKGIYIIGGELRVVSD